MPGRTGSASASHHTAWRRTWPSRPQTGSFVCGRLGGRPACPSSAPHGDSERLHDRGAFQREPHLVGGAGSEPDDAATIFRGPTAERPSIEPKVLRAPPVLRALGAVLCAGRPGSGAFRERSVESQHSKVGTASQRDGAGASGSTFSAGAGPYAPSASPRRTTPSHLRRTGPGATGKAPARPRHPGRKSRGRPSAIRRGRPPRRSTGRSPSPP
jgi:hypothetical protein